MEEKKQHLFSKVAQEYVGNYFVSTVELPYPELQEHKYETMVFPTIPDRGVDYSEIYQLRDFNIEGARRSHEMAKIWAWNETEKRKRDMNTYKFGTIESLKTEIGQIRFMIEQVLHEVGNAETITDELRDRVRYLESENDRLSVLLSRVQ